LAVIDGLEMKTVEDIVNQVNKGVHCVVFVKFIEDELLGLRKFAEDGHDKSAQKLLHEA